MTSRKGGSYIGGSSIERDPFYWNRVARRRKKTKKVLRARRSRHQQFLQDVEQDSSRSSVLITAKPLDNLP
jgi:hypothetical protein